MFSDYFKPSTFLKFDKDKLDYKLYVDHDNLNGQRIYEKLGMHRSHYVIYEAEL